MKKVYVLLTIIFMSITITSCTVDSVMGDEPMQQAESDTGGQNGTLPVPPPPPPKP